LKKLVSPVCAYVHTCTLGEPKKATMLKLRILATAFLCLAAAVGFVATDALAKREQIPGGFKVLDANGQALVYVYARETREQADIAKVLTFDEARRIAANVAKLPALLGAVAKTEEASP